MVYKQIPSLGLNYTILAKHNIKVSQMSQFQFSYQIYCRTISPNTRSMCKAPRSPTSHITAHSTYSKINSLSTSLHVAILNLTYFWLCQLITTLNYIGLTLAIYLSCLLSPPNSYGHENNRWSYNFSLYCLLQHTHIGYEYNTLLYPPNFTAMITTLYHYVLSYGCFLQHIYIGYEHNYLRS